jgi:hypothetical protein
MTEPLIHPLKIGLKYCGGCQPDYDRVAMVARIQKELDGLVEFLPADHPDIAMVLAVEGCQSACADLNPFSRLPVWIITHESQADDFIRLIKESDRQTGFL